VLGKFVNVRITAAFPNSLRGEFLGVAEDTARVSAVNWA